CTVRFGSHSHHPSRYCQFHHPIHSLTQSTNRCFLVDFTERLAQLDFLLREEECKRIDAEEKYAMLEQEMVSQAMEMEEKLAEMERTYHFRLMEQVIPEIAVWSCFRSGFSAYGFHASVLGFGASYWFCRFLSV